METDDISELSRSIDPPAATSPGYLPVQKIHMRIHCAIEISGWAIRSRRDISAPPSPFGEVQTRRRSATGGDQSV